VQAAQAGGLRRGQRSGPWLFVGEGPGADEDEQGEPFVGQAGKLLDNMLAAIGCRARREVLHRQRREVPPAGQPHADPEEAAACAPFLDRQIDLVHAALIVALGKTRPCACSAPKRASPAFAAACTTTTARRSS
jgi:DNA polymerase